MTLYMYDAAYAPSLNAVKSHGGIAMSCYLTGNYANTSPQPRKLLAAGLGVLGNYERAAGELVTCGKARGVQIGRESATAYIAKGVPGGKGYGIAYSVDVSVGASKFPAIGQAFDGIKQGLAGRFVVTAYGEGALIDYLVQTHRIVPVGWLSASTSFPGYNAASGNVSLVQRIGSPVAGTDQDRITDLASLAPLICWPANSPYAPKKPTQAPPVKVGHPLTQEEARDVQYVRFKNAPKRPASIYAFNGAELLWLTASDYAGLGRPAVRDLSAKSSNIYKAPIAAGTPDPRKA